MVLVSCEMEEKKQGKVEVPSFDELKPQPHPLPNFPSLDVSLGDERDPEPPIKPHSLNSFRMKEVDNLTIYTPPSPHAAYLLSSDEGGYEGELLGFKEDAEDSGRTSADMRYCKNREYDLAQGLELQKELDKREEVVAKTTQAYDIDWSDPAVLRYHAQQNRSFSKAEIEKEVMKRSGFDFRKPPAKRQKIREVSESVEEQSAGKEKEVSEEELKKLLVIVPVEEVYIEALHVKYPIIDWEVFTEESRSYWKIIRVGNHTEVYQVFEDMLKRFDRDDLEKLWDLVKKKFSSTEPTIDKEKVLWVELKRLFEPNDDDTLWKLQRYMHDPLKWKLYDICCVHHVSTERGHDIFMLVEKDYPLTRALMTVMLANKLQVVESSDMANEFLRKIFYQVERPRT
ncbi:hypothetical protein Tco_0613868 [Tanacetum coccineum]